MNRSLWTIVFIGVILIALSTFIWFLVPIPDTSSDITTSDETPYYYDLKEKNQNFFFNLVDPEEAPASIRDKVMLGYNIMLNTPQFASKYVGDKLSCTHCHFSAGNTLGGKNGGISLVGVVNVYPSYSPRFKKMINLKERINSCFTRSMNGKAAPEDSPEMNALISYLEWISKDVKSLKSPPWLGLLPLKSAHIPDKEEGEKIYNNVCLACHQANGGGTEGVPPIWGKDSFNDGAGMSKLETMTSFIYLNMPYQNAYLTVEESMDVASFVLSQPRPHLQASP